MKIVRASTLYNGESLLKDVYVGFDETIEYVGKEKPEGEMIGEGVVTPAFVDGHSHIGMARAGEPSGEDESNEQMDSLFPLVNALHSIYMDDSAFAESVESGVLYSTILPGSGNPIGGRAVLVRNFGRNIRESYIKDIGVKAALGYNPRSTTEWKGRRPTTRMGAVALLREGFTKAQKAMALVKLGKKLPEEIEPVDEVFMDILSGKLKMMVHLHREDDAFVLLDLIREFKIRAVLNHGMDIYREETFTFLKENGVDLIYGPLDSHPYKVELKHETWRNTEKVLKSGINFGLMSDHPVILQRNMFYTLRHFMRFGLTRENAISKVTSETARIIGADGIGSVKNGFKASLVLWNGDPFSLDGHPSLVVGEGNVVYED
ncbi:imidazolonepropionase [uncultured archaeon]|nr:imidazolonepropionase [uncultured archaeon]